MREAKQYLLSEIEGHLSKSGYFFLVDYQQMTVLETTQLRTQLRQQGAEFHVVKNRIFREAMKTRSQDANLSPFLKGQTAIVLGGKNPSEVAKILQKFAKDKSKLPTKAGLMEDKVLSAKDVDTLSKLPSLDVLRAQLLSLFNTPATQMVRVLQAVPQGVLNVLQAHAKKE